MPTYFVTVCCDVFCTWSKYPPRYRAYINDELFTERTWIWQNVYLEETFQILAPQGHYRVRYELLDSKRAELMVKNFKVMIAPDPQWSPDMIENLASINQLGELQIRDILAQNVETA